MGQAWFDKYKPEKTNTEPPMEVPTPPENPALVRPNPNGPTFPSVQNEEDFPDPLTIVEPVKGDATSHSLPADASVPVIPFLARVSDRMQRYLEESPEQRRKIEDMRGGIDQDHIVSDAVQILNASFPQKDEGATEPSLEIKQPLERLALRDEMMDTLGEIRDILPNVKESLKDDQWQENMGKTIRSITEELGISLQSDEIEDFLTILPEIEEKATTYVLANFYANRNRIQKRMAKYFIGNVLGGLSEKLTEKLKVLRAKQQDEVEPVVARPKVADL